MNKGKDFELDFKKSVPKYALLYRLPDAAQAFSYSNNLRFSRKNPFDFLLWNSKRHMLFAIEIKTVAGKSISFERNKNEDGDIHYHQIKGLNEWNKYDGITCGFIIEFRAIKQTLFININEFNKLINAITKKSFNFNDLNNYKIQYYSIGREKVRTRYKYHVDEFLTTIKN